jgi:hypothetical protein
VRLDADGPSPKPLAVIFPRFVTSPELQIPGNISPASMGVQTLHRSLVKTVHAPQAAHSVPFKEFIAFFKPETAVAQ